MCGIIGFAVAVEEMVHHPDALPPGEVVAALGVGVALFIGSSAFAYWRTCGRVLVARLVILVVLELGLWLVASNDPVWPLAITAIGLFTIAVIENGTVARQLRYSREA